MGIAKLFYAPNEPSDLFTTLGILAYGFISNVIVLIISHWWGGCSQHYFKNGYESWRLTGTFCCITSVLVSLWFGLTWFGAFLLGGSAFYVSYLGTMYGTDTYIDSIKK